MAAFMVHLTVLASAFYPVPVVQPPQEGYAYYGVAPALPIDPRAEVFMNTKYGDPKVLAYKKKDPKTGSSLGLKGYTVGSRAPPRAKSSGTIAQFGYGIDNLYGGKKAAPAGGSSGGSSASSLGPVLLVLAVFLLVASAK